MFSMFGITPKHDVIYFVFVLIYWYIYVFMFGDVLCVLAILSVHWLMS